MSKAKVVVLSSNYNDDPPVKAFQRIIQIVFDIINFILTYIISIVSCILKHIKFFHFID
jgi:hypothetical protein